MEYLPGITLRELLREHRRLTVQQTVTIMDAVLSGLAAAHRAGIVHRDVKPENVLLAEDGRIKIGDFGLARATTANTATGAQLLGTIAYLAPELVTRGTADARSDIYSLGIMLYEMLAGEQPYQGEQPMQIAFQHATDSVPRPSVKNPGVPEQLDELVLWATEKNPDDRPLDAREMLERFRDIEHELGVHPQVARSAPTSVIRDEGGAQTELTKVLPSAITGPMAAIDDVDNASRLRTAMRRRSRRGGWVLALVLGLAALAAAIGWWFGSGPGSLVPVPDVANMTFEQAQGILAQQGLAATQEDVFDYDIAAGTTVGSDPGPGSRVDQGTTVAVLVSKGPQDHAVSPLAGLPADQARAALAGVRVSVGDDQLYFSPDAPENSVLSASISPRDGSAAFDCSQGCTIHEGDSAVLSVSVGPVPDVAGQSVGDATAALNAKNLQVAGTAEETSEDVDEGLVIRIADKGDGTPWRPGEAVTLVVSSGPPLFPVPNVVGMTRDQAKAALDAAGFKYSYFGAWDLFPDAATRVEAQDPTADSQRLKGTVVSLAIESG
jgi:serine/threonine-protein kinase